MEVTELKQRIEKLKKAGDKKVTEPGNKKRKLNEFENDMMMFDLQKSTEAKYGEETNSASNTSKEMARIMLKPKRIVP